MSECRGRERPERVACPLGGLEGGYWEKGVSSWAREVRGPFLHLPARTPVFSSVRTKMTVAWQGCKGQRDTLYCLAPMGLVSALKELVLTHMCPGKALATPGHPGRKAGLQGDLCLGQTTAAALLALVQPCGLSRSHGIAQHSGPRACFQGGHLERQLSLQDLRAKC